MKKINQTAAWRKLTQHYQVNQKFDMRQAFAEETDRFQRFSLNAAGLFLDFSKNRISDETVQLLVNLANEAGLAEKITGMFSAQKLNCSEQRPVLHIAARNRSNSPIAVDGNDVMPQINATLQQMRKFTEAVRSGEYLGASGKKITDVVNISIGGSHLGPEAVTTALEAYSGAIRCHFVANVDGTDIVSALRSLDPETTLFIVGSKSFTTIETMTNAETAKAWLVEKLGEVAIAKHFVAATTNPDKAKQFGIAANNIFQFWPWIGGRFSVWSSIGLIIALSVGMDNFEKLLDGAHAMDQHFRTAPFAHNMPVILALLGVWYHNFFQAESYTVVGYSHYLRYLARYLQQVDMESNGKQVDEEGNVVDISTGPVIFGDCGTNSQHSFHQLFHQGTHLIPIDFIIPVNSLHPLGNHHDLLFANCLGQAEALLNGKTAEQCHTELTAAGVDEARAAMLAAHKAMPGNRPSNTLLMAKLTPQALGALMALYELKIFVQGVIFGINSFDQWGVELGKALTNSILPSLLNEEDISDHDPSTQGLIRYYHQYQGQTALKDRE
ncbi:MAG: glucose-6-phosphate isomerase [Gammaproteobacteria bacterium]|nr:glucose-6-phosphate isomerase [Gammaproteobacteria bacterium]